MSASLSSRKTKRSRTDSEANDSFVKNVTSRMSGLLPATITRWFSSSSSSNTNGSTVVESTDSSTEDEATDGLRTPNQRNQPSQPPAKRMRYSTPGTSSYYYPETKSTSTNTETTETYSTLQSPIKDTLKVETNYVSTPSCSPSETSTINENEKDPSIIYIYQDSVTSVNNSVEQTRKSIFGSEERLQESCARTAANTYKDLTQPYFKPGLLCTPFYTSRPVYGGTRNVYVNRPNIKHKTKPLVNKVENNSSVNISNSAKRIMDLLENYSSPVSEARRISRLVNSSCDLTPDTSLNTSIDANNSKAASYKKRELYVPSFASILQLKQKARLNETTSAARQIIASHSSSLNTLPYPASTSGTSQSKENSQESLTTKMKTRLTRINRGENKESESNKLPIVELPTAVLQIDKDNLPKFSLDTPVSHSSDNKQKIPESVPTGTNSVAQVPKVVLSKNEAPKVKPIDMLDGERYTFSSPIRISEDNFVTSTETYKFGSPERSVEPTKNKNKIVSSSNNNEEDEENIGIQSHQSDKTPKTNTSQSCVSLEAAKPQIEKPIFNKCSDCKVVASQLSSDKCFDCEKKAKNDKMASKLPQSAISSWKCQDCWVNNDVGVEKCVCCGAKNSSASQNSSSLKVSSEIPKSTWKCQDCWVNNEGTDKCVCCGAKQSIAPKVVPTLQPQKPVNTWKCEECWVDNNDGADKCVCCGTKNSSTTKTEQNTNSETSDWKCGVCWLKNKSHDDKCVACSGPKPATKEQNQNKISSPSLNSTNNNSLLKNIVKTQSNKWECPSCFVHNENNISKCVCCETEKPGITKESEKKSFNFGVSPNVSFKFGINPKQTTTETEPKPASIFGQSTQEMETNNNHISKAPSFTFGIQNKKPEKEISKEENKIVETPKAAFTFGIPKDNSTPNAAPAFKINTDMFKPSTQSSVSNISTAKDSERAQEVPSVDQSQLRAVEPAPKLTGLFSASASKDSTLNKSITNALTPFNSNFTAESSAGPTLTTASNTLGTSNASFSMTGNQPSNNMFTTSVAPTSANAFASVQTPPVTSSVSLFQKNEQSSPMMSFFQKSENTSLSLFNKNEPAATTTSVSVLPSAPVFSFGTSTPTTAPSNEKSGFTFTFGRDSKNETPSMFKLPFGGTPDNSTSNKFMMPSSNINSGNMLPSSNLAGNSVGNNMPLMLSGGNNNPLGGLTTGNGLPSGNLMNNLTQNQLSMESNVITNNAPAASGDMFNTPVQKENMWSTGNNNTQGSMFGSSEPSNNLQKRPFAFGASSGTSKPFSPVGSSPFDNSNQPRPLFGISNQPAANPFGTAAPSPMAPNMFSSQPSNPAPSVGMFGNTNTPASQPPAFGFAVSSFSSFDTNNMNQSMNPNPTPAFNFGAPQQPSGVFGFGQQQQQQQTQQQQQQQQQPQQQGVYNFGGGAPQVQFTVGSAPNTAGRRVRRAFRRTQR